MIACVMTAPSKDMRVASQGGTLPPCKGSVALPDRFAIESYSPVRTKAYQGGGPASGPSSAKCTGYVGTSKAERIVHSCRKAAAIVESDRAVRASQNNDNSKYTECGRVSVLNCRNI